MLVSEMTYNLGVWLILKKYTFKKNNLFYDYRIRYVACAYNCMLNQSGQHF